VVPPVIGVIPLATLPPRLRGRLPFRHTHSLPALFPAGGSTAICRRESRWIHPQETLSFRSHRTTASNDGLAHGEQHVLAGFIGQAYSSATAIPLQVTRQASVWVFARTSPTVDQESSAAFHFSVSTARDRKSFSSATYARTGPIPRGMPLVGKISSIRVSAKAKYSGHFHESRSIRSRIASEGSTMTSSLAEVSSPTCGSLGSSGPLCV